MGGKEDMKVLSEVEADSPIDELVAVGRAELIGLWVVAPSTSCVCKAKSVARASNGRSKLCRNIV